MTFRCQGSQRRLYTNLMVVQKKERLRLACVAVSRCLATFRRGFVLAIDENSLNCRRKAATIDCSLTVAYASVM